MSTFGEMAAIYSKIAEQERIGNLSEELSEQSRNLGKLYADLQFFQFERDQYIAGRINETLGEGETGVLFIGANHDMFKKLLSSDIRYGPLDEKIDEAAREVLGEVSGNGGEHEKSHFFGGESKE